MNEERQNTQDGLPPELLLLLEAFRQEFDAKIGSLRLWGCIALLGGGTLGGVISRFAYPTQTGSAVGFVVSLFT